MRLVNTECLFPNPDALVQEIRIKNARKPMAILREVAFLHFQRTALVTERPDEAEKKYRARVVKVGIDPHFSFANMLCDVAWSRAYGASTFLFPEEVAGRGESGMSTSTRTPASQLLPGAPTFLAALVEEINDHQSIPTCGGCSYYPFTDEGPAASGHCPIQNATVRSKDPGCPLYDSGMCH